MTPLQKDAANFGEAMGERLAHRLFGALEIVVPEKAVVSADVSSAGETWGARYARRVVSGALPPSNSLRTWLLRGALSGYVGEHVYGHEHEWLMWVASGFGAAFFGEVFAMVSVIANDETEQRQAENVGQSVCDAIGSAQ